MADNDFFSKEPKVDEQTQGDKITIGEEEYSQDELQRLVGLGKIGLEAEEKYGVTLDKVWPNHQRTINEKLTLENKLAEIEKAKLEQQRVPAQTLNEDEVSRRAKEELGKLGYVPADEVRKIVTDTISGYRLLDDAQSLIDEMKADGNPETTVDELLKFMADPSNPKDPRKAYKMMFEPELDAIKEKKLESLRNPGLVTQQTSIAGSKVPAPQKITNDNLQEALRAALRGNSNI